MGLWPGLLDDLLELKQREFLRVGARSLILAISSSPINFLLRTKNCAGFTAPLTPTLSISASRSGWRTLPIRRRALGLSGASARIRLCRYRYRRRRHKTCWTLNRDCVPSDLRNFADLLPRGSAAAVVACVAVIAALFLFLFSLPARSLWFGPAWLALVLADRMGLGYFPGPHETCMRGIERHRIPAEGVLARVPRRSLLPIRLRGFLSTLVQGGGDAGWYGAVLADMVAQVRAGVFPVWVGQSAYQFNGSISPIRIAPAFNYLGAFLDALTLHRLGTVELLNLLMLSIAIAGMASCYFCLRALLPKARWLALALSTLFLACPAVARASPQRGSRPICPGPPRR